jgi:diguanylate cyclase (GGDEF)-like protein
MAAELRENPRFSTYIDAQLQMASGQNYECQIADYSQTGMHLLWPHLPPADTSGDHTLSFELDGKAVSVGVQWIYCNEQHAGIHFAEHHDQLFLQLQEFNQKHRKSKKIDDSKRKQYIDVLAREVQGLCDRLPKQWLPEFIEGAFDKANRAHNTAEQQLWMKLQKDTKAQASNLLRHFTQNILKQFQRWQEGKPEYSPEHEPTTGELRLSLVQQADFEDWLLAKVTASHLQSRLAHLTFELRQLTDTLSQAPIEYCFNPIGPGTVTEAFRDAMEQMRLPQEARALAFEVFEQVASNMLQGTYQTLIKQIDIPLTFRFRREPPAPPAQGNGSSQGGYGSGGNGAASTGQSGGMAATGTATATAAAHGNYSDSVVSFQRHQEEARQAYANIQNLMKLRYQRAEATAEEELLPAAQPEQISEVVSHLAQDISLSDGHVLENVQKALAQQDVALPVESRDAIDTMEQVTQHLLSSQQVAGFVKPHIEQLGWPLLQLMLKDPSLLFNPEHPGRLILNLLAKLGQLTTTGEAQLAKKLDGLIGPVAKNIESDEHSLEELLESLQSMVNSAERKAKQNADRVAQAAEGEHKLQTARKRIENLIGKDSANRTLPSCVVDWLQNGWQQMLTLLLLRDGVDSKRFKGAVKLYRQVLALFSQNNSGRRELLQRFGPMMDLARAELDRLNGNLPEHQRWHDDIMQAAEEHLNQGEIREAIDLPSFEAKPAEVVPQGRGTRRAMNLQIGDWLLLVEQDQSVSVAWIAQDASRFACVNHSGMKVMDFSLGELARALDEGRIKRLYEQEESAVDRSVDKLVQQIYRDLSEQANVDPLTGLFNRQHFLRMLQERLETSIRTSAPSTLCMIDIDQFKLINKNYGVEGGDACLQSVAALLSDAENAIAARIGSNEFAVLFHQQDIEQAEASARILKKHLESTSIDSRDESFRIHVSVGLASMNADLNDAAELLEQAESSCLVAKEKGGSRIVRYEFDDATHQRQDQFMVWGNKLNQALSNNQLQVLCVPVTPMQERNRNKEQYEVLISVLDEKGAQIPPMEFLQAADNFNRMYMIDRWTIERLVQWMADNPDTASEISRFILRLSGHAINDDSLLAYIFEQAREKDIPVRKLCFELNETSAIRNLEDAADFMHEMRSLGCQFVLSDFGTGQSSFEYLKTLPVDYVKIDTNFTANLHTSSADYALVKSIQEIAHFMAKKTIAEHSANNSVWEILRTIGIDYIVAAPEEHVALEQLKAG